MSDTYGFLAAIPIRSGMTVHLEIEHPSVREENFKWNDDTVPLIITNISDNISDQKREVSRRKVRSKLRAIKSAIRLILSLIHI
mgnify:CR=1 FL=1